MLSHIGLFMKLHYIYFPRYGSRLVSNGDTDFTNMTKAITAIVFGATMLGHSASHSADVGKAKMAAEKFFALVDRKPVIDITSRHGKR